MKNIIILLFCLIVSVLNAQTEIEKKLQWDYPVKPGMESWKQFKSMDEMYQACQIPDNVLKQLDTESLVDICLNFPAPPLFPLYNTPQQGFMEYYTNFNGIRELFQRKEAGQYLLKRYALMSFTDFNPQWSLHQQGKFVNHYKFVESILSQPHVISTLDTKEREILLKESIRKIDEKIIKDDLFSAFSLEINLWVIGKILYNMDKSIFLGNDRQSLQTTLETGMFVDIDVNMLYQQAKKYVYGNK